MSCTDVYGHTRWENQVTFNCYQLIFWAVMVQPWEFHITFFLAVKQVDAGLQSFFSPKTVHLWHLSTFRMKYCHQLIFWIVLNQEWEFHIYVCLGYVNAFDFIPLVIQIKLFLCSFSMFQVPSKRRKGESVCASLYVPVCVYVSPWSTSLSPDGWASWDCHNTA